MDPRIHFSLEYEDGLSLVVWRQGPAEIGLGIVKAGAEPAQIPLTDRAAAELAVQLAGAVPEALAAHARELPAPIALALAAALLEPHMADLLGAAALVKQARALERARDCVETA
jgi:hypothetical protein